MTPSRAVLGPCTRQTREYELRGPVVRPAEFRPTQRRSTTHPASSLTGSRGESRATPSLGCARTVAVGGYTDERVAALRAMSLAGPQTHGARQVSGQQPMLAQLVASSASPSAQVSSHAGRHLSMNQELVTVGTAVVTGDGAHWLAVTGDGRVPHLLEVSIT